MESEKVVLTNSFEEDVLNLVTSPKFGSYMKSDLNLLLFHYAMLRSVDGDERFSGVHDQLKYYRLNRQDQSRLAKQLNLPIGRIKSYIEQSASLYGREPSDTELPALLRPLVENARPADEWYKNGTVAVMVHNKAVKELLITRFDSIGAFADYGFNQDLMRIPAFDLLALIGKDDKETVAAFIDAVRNSGKLTDDQKSAIDQKAIKAATRQGRREAVSRIAKLAGPIAQTAIGAVL